MLSDLPKVTKPVKGRGKIQSAVYLTSNPRLIVPYFGAQGDRHPGIGSINNSEPLWTEHALLCVCE